MACAQLGATHSQTVAATDGSGSRRSRGVRLQATASSDVATDATAEARRRLARQFRRHKLEAQSSVPATLSSVPGLKPGPQQPQPLLSLEWQQQRGLAHPYSMQVGLGAAGAGSTARSAAAAAAAQEARELLERQFHLGLQPSSSSPASLSNASDAALSQLPPSLLLTASADSSPGKDITRAIKRASDWRQVQSLVQEHAPHLNTRHLCASLVRLARLCNSTFWQQEKKILAADKQYVAFVQQLYRDIAAVQLSLEYRQVCNVLWAASQLQDAVHPSTTWLTSMYKQAVISGNAANSSKVEQPSEQKSSQAGSHAMMHVAQMAYSIARLQEQVPQNVQQPTLSWLLSMSQGLLQDSLHLQHQHQSQRLGMQQPQNNQQPHQGAASVPQQQQPPDAGMSPRDIATLAWSFATLGLLPSTSWLSAFASAVSCKGLLAAANSRDLSNLLWATATFSKLAVKGSAAANSLDAAATALLQACQEVTLRSCDAQSASNILWAFATLGLRPSVAWLNRLLHHIEASVVTYMTPQALSVTLWALAALGVIPQPSCMSALLASSAHNMQRFTAQGLCNTIWALAVLEKAPGKAWQSAFFRHSRATVTNMTSQGLVNCLWAVARLGLQPPQEWVVDVAAQLLQQGLQGLSSQGVSNVLWAMGRIKNSGRQGQQLLHAALQQATVLLERQVPKQQQDKGNSNNLQHVDTLSAVSSDSSSTGGFNVYEVAGMLHTVCQLQAQQQMMASEPCNSSISNREAALGSHLLPKLISLLQLASQPLLSTAGPGELSILFWSQNSLAEAGHAVNVTRQWLDAWLAASQACIGSASSRDLAQWIWCLAKRGVRLPAQWLASFQVASFRQMGQANSQDLSNMLWALGSLKVVPEPAWLQQHLSLASRRQSMKQLQPQHLANIGSGLARLGHRPDREWLARYQEDIYAVLQDFKPQELTNVLWALAVLNCKAEQALLHECLVAMVSNLSSYKVNEVAVSLWAMARLRGQPDLRLMAAALQHCFTQARQLTPKGLSMLMWSVGNMATSPPKAWVAKLLVATQVHMSGFSAQELSMLAVSLARLEYRPTDAWLDSFTAAAAEQMDKFGSQALANTLWALATLHYIPTESWMCAFDDHLTQHLASFTPAQLAMTMWAMSSLQWLPRQPLWQHLQERVELHSASYCLRSQRMLSRAVRVLDKIEVEGGPS